MNLETTPLYYSATFVNLDATNVILDATLVTLDAKIVTDKFTNKPVNTP